MARPKQVVAAPRPESWTQQQATSSLDVPAKQESSVEMKATPPEVDSTGDSSRKRESRSDGDGPLTEPLRHQQPPLKTPVKTAVECEEMPSRAANGVLPLTPRVNGDTTAVGEAVWLSSDSEPDDPVIAPENRKMEKHYNDDSAPSMDCTICSGHMFVAMEVHEHPTLCGVGICGDCFDFLFSGPYTKDKEDGTEEQCRWCGEGGVVVLCDSCDKVFCQKCIIRNYGCRRGLVPILSSSSWSCFCCNPEPLRVHVDRREAFLLSVPPGINPPVRQGNAEISVPRRASVPSPSVQRKDITSIRGHSTGVKDRCRVRSRDAGRCASDGDPGDQGKVETIADLMARAKERRRNQANALHTDFQSSRSRAKHTEGSEAQNALTGRRRAGCLDRQHTTRRTRRRRLPEAKPKEDEEKEEKEEEAGKGEKGEETKQEAGKGEKGEKGEEKKEEAETALPVPLARTWIRPHQMNAMRQKVALRRALAEAERLKGDVLQTNLPSNDQQHRHSDRQAMTGLLCDERQLLQRRQGEPDAADPKLPRGIASTQVLLVNLSGSAGRGARKTEPIRDANLHVTPKFCF